MPQPSQRRDPSAAIPGLKPLSAALARSFAVAAVCSQLPGAAFAAGNAPTPGARISPTALPTGATTTVAGTIGGRTIYAPEVVRGQFADRPYTVTENADGSVAGTITQTSSAGILQWQKFDIGSNATVTVVQPSSTAVLLNKVSDGDYNHSTLIEGKLNANGQVYIYNPNGIIFGKNSQVNVNTLVATSLRITDSRFMAGLLSSTSAAFSADPDASYANTYTDGTGRVWGLPGAVTVEGDGSGQANLTAANGGKILLVAPNIANDGVLSAPDGQVLLAAGLTTYLAAPSDTTMRGFQAGVANNAISSSSGGSGVWNGGASAATNGDVGKINVGTGNATLIGKAVNQMGLISATTSVSSNGSIYLFARDGTTDTTLNSTKTLKDAAVPYGGALTLGADSVTEILPTVDDDTTTAADFTASQIALSGKSVHLAGSGGNGAKILAPAGEVIITAQADINSPTPIRGNGNSIILDSGALIDVSGTTSTRLAMSSNVIDVELRGTELADNLLLRNSALRGKTVGVDMRKGNLKIANISGWLDLVTHNVGQATTGGGKVTMTAEDAVVLNAGSTVNVSGGHVEYLPGYILTSQLLWNGRLFDIANAPADRIYSGAVTATPGLRTYERGYIEGYNAGSLSVDASAISLGGTLTGTATAGAKQRNVTSYGMAAWGDANWETLTGSKQRNVTSRPQGGQLIIGYYDSGSNTYGMLQDQVTFGPADRGVTLDPAALTANGFSRLGVYSGGGEISINQAIALAPGGSLTLRTTGAVDIGADISAAGGSISATAGGTTTVAEGVAIDVAGRWTNDRVLAADDIDAQGNLTRSVVTGGGSISLSGISVALGNGSRFDASGGAWLSSNGSYTYGSGGSITVNASTDVARSGRLTLGNGVSFGGYGASKGGKLTLTAHNVTIGSSPDPTSDVNLTSNFFQAGGFASYDIRAAGNLTVAAGTIVEPRTANWVKDRFSATTASGAMSDAFSIATLPLAGATTTRSGASLALEALSAGYEGEGRLNLQAGSKILADPGATVTLNAGRQITVDGTVSARGGTIDLTLTPLLANLANTDTNSGGVPYFADRSIWLGADALLDASGTSALLWQDGKGLTQGNLLDGGRINIGHYEGNPTVYYAAPGYVVIEKGAQLDVSGTTATMTLLSGARGGRTTRSVASVGGSVDIRAREGLLVEGTLSGAGGNASAAGGSLTLALDREDTRGSSSYPTAALNLTVLSSDAGLPTLPSAGSDLSSLEGQGYVTAATLNQGGFDWVTLKSGGLNYVDPTTNLPVTIPGTVSFDLSGGSLALQSRAGLTVNAPAIAASGAVAGSTLNLIAPYVALGNSDWRYQADAPAATASTVGGVTLKVNAETVDIAGKSALAGFDDASVTASGDIRLVGVVPIDLSKKPTETSLPSIEADGAFSVAGNMAFTSAQLYPTTLSQFSLDADGTIAFYPFGTSASTPLSAAGALTVNATNIVQDGTVRAPLGHIVFDAADTLTYGAGSLTSVSAGSTIPLGMVLNGLDWIYDFGNGHEVNLSDSSASNYFALPDKGIVSRAPTVKFGLGAVQDLSGGGDLYAYEFTAGPGGSRDVLATINSSSTATVFAIVPTYAGDIAPVDAQYDQSGGLKVGDRIYLSGIPGLAAGYYTLLPGHYALLPGAYSVTAVAGTTDMAQTANLAKLDGSWLVSGYRASLGGGVDGRLSGFLVKSSSLVRQESEFTDYSGNAFLANLASLPKDGGHVVFDVTRSLDLNGVVHLTGTGSGANGIADISAPDIEVVSNATDALADGLPGDTVKLTANDLAAMGADSLLLGGVRTTTSDRDAISVGADNVYVQNDTSHPLAGPEIILAANDTVKIVSSSAVQAEGPLKRTPRPLTVVDTSAPTAGADGALLRVSNGAAVTLGRNHADADGVTHAPAGDKGTLDIAADVTLSASGSMLLDATKATKIGSAFGLASGAALGLGASRISLGSGAPSTVDGLRFDDTALEAMSNLSSLALTSYSTFDLYGAVSLGGAAMTNLGFTGGGMRAASDGASATFTAQTISFARAGTDAAATASGGSLAFTATNNIKIASGAFGLHGFSSTTLDAGSEIRAIGTGGALAADADLALNAGRITAGTGNDATFTAGGALTLAQGSGTVGSLPALEFGGSLAFQGATITAENANIIALAGSVSLSGTNGVTVEGGTLSAAGGSKTFSNDTVAYAPAGTITLDGGAGNVTVDSNAALDVSASHADAGTIAVTAIHGAASLNGTLKGGTDDINTYQAGSFALDVGSVGSADAFAALNSKLNGGGFTESRSVRARNGDIAVSGTLKAHTATLSADNGNIEVTGTIDASGAKGGSIGLYAAEPTATSGRGNVTIKNGAQLLANATAAATSAAGSTGDGGSIIIGTSTADASAPTAASGDASIAIESGALLDVRGAGAGQGGTVLLRAPRLADNTDVAIAALDASTIKGSRSTSIEAYKVYSYDSNVALVGSNTVSDAVNVQVANATGARTGTYWNEASTLIGSASSIFTRLGLTDASVVLTPGLEVQSGGNLTVSVNEASKTAKQNRGWNLDQWRFTYTAPDGTTTVTAPGVLTLRAAGDLIINGSISDGFVKASSASMPDWTLDTSGNDSWSYHLVGGADTAAANPNTTVAGTGDVKITFARTDYKASDLPVALVRTGTGSISLAAGRNVILDTLRWVVDPDTGAQDTAGILLDGDFRSLSAIDSRVGATVYTAGKATSLSSAIKNVNNAAYGNSNSTGAAFTSDGGSISIVAGDSVIGPVTHQMINGWLFRQGRASIDASGNVVFERSGSSLQNSAWWSRFDYFDQGIATFGGGDISIVAETGNVSNVSASAATNAVAGANPGAVSEQGGGDLTVHAGGDIRGGIFYVQNGTALLTADGSIAKGNHLVANSEGLDVTLAPVLALGNAQMRAAARKDLNIEGVFNPTMTLQSVQNTAADDPSSAAGNQAGSFLTYGKDSSVALTSVAGNLVFDQYADVILSAAGGAVFGSAGTDDLVVNDYQSLYTLAPGSVYARALSGDVTLSNGFALAPSATGQLELLAGGSILLKRTNSDNPLVMLDIDPANLPSAENPSHGTSVFGNAPNDSLLVAFAGKTVGTFYHAQAGLHAEDDTPVKIIALDGDIRSDSTSKVYPALVLPKKAEIAAGRDIADVGFNIQQLAATDVTSVTAGRDIVDTTVPATVLNTVAHVVTGPGRVDFVAGRNFDLGDSVGVVTKGNLDNPYLPDTGAGITVTAGAHADYANFAASYASSLADLSFAAQALLVTDMKSWLKQLYPSMPASDIANLTTTEAWAAFTALPEAARRSVLNDLFYEKLAEVSGAKGGASLDLAAFDDVIASLFPTSGIDSGDINVFSSQLKTDRGGTISIFAPGGSVYAGLTKVPAYVQGSTRKASDLGIFTVNGGAIQSLVKENFLVNLGRVFTLGGGDITLVSQYGDIDAGKGAKTSQATPPPVIKTDANGNTEVDISGSIAGSGIATLRSSADVPASDVYPIAPRGIFDAGDAGVRSTGSVNIVAQTVLNANNIAAAGSISGAKTIDTSAMGGAVATPSAPPPTKTSDFANLADTSSGAGNTLSVELLGYGDSAGQQGVTQDDQNGSPAGGDDEHKKKNKAQ